MVYDEVQAKLGQATGANNSGPANMMTKITGNTNNNSGGAFGGKSMFGKGGFMRLNEDEPM